MKNLIFIILVFTSLHHSVFSQSSVTEKKDLVPALLVIDVQNDYLPMMSQEDQETALKKMNLAIWVFRQHDLPVIRVYHSSEEWGPESGTEAFEFHESLMIEESDEMITKTYGSSFNKTDLDSLLSTKGINTLFLCGLSSTGCVLATYFDAGNYDYDAFLIKDALLGPEVEFTEQVEQIFEAIDLGTMNFMLQIAK